jgi:predicted NAD/FAD-dependent oxidoreductase
VAALEGVRYERTLVAMGLCERGDCAIERFEDRAFEHGPLARAVIEPIHHGGRSRLLVTLHASDALSTARYDEGDDGPWVEELLAHGQALLNSGAWVATDRKRWRYARVISARACENGAGYLAMDRDATLFAVGDGVADALHGQGAEAAWASGSALASSLLGE